MRTVVERLRRKGWIAFALALMIVIIFGQTPYESNLGYELLLTPALLLVALCVIGRLWCLIYIGGRKDKELTTDGPYSLWRNPLYVFSFLGLIGIGLGSRMLLITLVMVVGYLVSFYFIIRSEESRLVELFGDDYEAYRRKVKIVVPNFSNYWTRDTFDVNPRYFVKSMIDVGMFPLGLAFMEVFHRLKLAGILPKLWTLPF